MKRAFEANCLFAVGKILCAMLGIAREDGPDAGTRKSHEACKSDMKMLEQLKIGHKINILSAAQVEAHPVEAVQDIQYPHPTKKNVCPSINTVCPSLSVCFPFSGPESAPRTARA